jgi:hypothetical protein
MVAADGWTRWRGERVGDGRLGEPDGRRDPVALAEDHQETANGLPVAYELEHGSLVGSHLSHHGPVRRPQRSFGHAAFGVGGI